MTRRTQQDRVWLLLPVLAALALRLYRLDTQSLWYDEAVTADLAQRTAADLIHWTAGDIQPPLYYLIMAGWAWLAGLSEWSLRAPSAWFGVLAAPLLAAVTIQLTGRRAAGLLAAWLAALHPLLVYYGQEARMYTLLLALGISAVYCALRMTEERGRALFGAGYVAAATAALYTHYFALFLLGGLALALLWIQRRRAPAGAQGGNVVPYGMVSFAHSAPLAGNRLGRGFGPLALANSLVALLYLPWLGVIANQWGGDRSYWQGAFKVGEAVRSVAVTFTSGEAFHESIGVWLLIPYLLITLLALWRLLGRAQSSGETAQADASTLMLAGFWLLTPVIGVLMLAALAPKFNARYGLVALPGLLLLWSAGLTRWPAVDQRIGRAGRSTWWGARLAIALLLVGALWGNAHWFFDRAFTKDDWRGVATFLRPRLAPDERVVLVSGHAYPAWNYYAPDIPVVRLPAIDVLDVDAVLTFANTVEPLRAAFNEQTGMHGAWLVGWQDEVVDPTGVTPVQLELGGREKGQSATFWGIGLRRFSQIRPHRIADAPPITQPRDERLGGQIGLLGYHLMENGDLLFFWKRLADDARLADDYQMTGETVDAGGAVVARLADRRLSTYGYPVTRWPMGETVMGHVPAADWLGPTPALGAYTLRLGVYGVSGGRIQPLPAADGRTVIDLPVMVTDID
ncbi:MAG: glycosyltransferase family 39 protein [Caldilineaceae bacterium]|nr:glycosyltransferase family 39 protein [Caldilineaceae bacterium]